MREREAKGQKQREGWGEHDKHVEARESRSILTHHQDGTFCSSLMIPHSHTAYY